MAFALSVGLPQGRDMVGGGGVGLGLAIARTIIQAHGGTVVLRNVAAVGLEAIVCLPLGDA
jgi:signal transduction histidine kinase